MKKTILLFFALFHISNTLAQDVSVEKSVFGVQTGFLGAWIHNESRLSNSLALRSEIGVDMGIYDSTPFNSSGLFGGLALTLEPRWYYNLEKRAKKGRRTDNNSGNFISIKTTLHPDDALIFSGDDRLNLIGDISIVPTWGIRRHVGKHFAYETGIGVGYVKYFDDPNSFFEQADIAVNLHLRIGYTF